MISDVTVMSTGRMWLHPRHLVGGGVPAPVWIALSRRWTGPLPVNVFLLRHTDGDVLFDLGQDRRSVTDPDAYFYVRGPVGVLHRRVARFEIGADDTLPAVLARHGRSLADVRTVILSHLHQDHVGGLGDVRRMAPEAAVVADAEELDVLGSRTPEARGVLARHVDLPGVRWRTVAYRRAGADLQPFDRAAQPLGDPSLILLPTPGHTPGSVTALVRAPDRPPLLLVGDATFAEEYLRCGHVPGVGNTGRMRRTSTNLLALADRLGAVVLPAHDPSAAARLRRAWPPEGPGGRQRTV